MAEWQHKRCGTVLRGTVPPPDCPVCAPGSGREEGWRYLGPSPNPPPEQRSKRRQFSRAKRTRIYERDNYTCVQCGLDGREDPDNLLTLDHRVPLAKGGGNEDENLQTMCPPCNVAKGDEMPLAL